MRVFVSHADRDRLYAAHVAKYVREWGYEPFVDFERGDGIPGGARWEEEILEAIRLSASVVICFTNHVTTSLWCFGEYLVARNLGKPIIPLLVADDADAIWPFIKADIQYIDLRNDPDGAMGRLQEALERVTVGGAGAPVPEIGGAPFLGLKPLGEANADLFFGRDADRDALLRRLRIRSREASDSYLCITGASGSGKSSLLQAGLLPALRQGAVGGSEKWVHLGFSPGSHPMRRLAEVLRSVLPQMQDLQTVITALSRDHSGLGLLASEALSAGAAEMICISIDQLEESLTQTSEEERLHFLSSLQHCILDVGCERVRILATLRADFVAPMLADAGRAGCDILAKPNFLSRLTSDELRAVIEGPIRITGWTIESRLVDRLVADAAGVTDPLPLLAFSLQTMHSAAGVPGELGMADYEATGGLEGAVGKHADAVFADLEEDDEDLVVSALVENLVVLSQGGVPTRRRAPRSNFPVAALPMVEALVEQRLLVASANEQGDAEVEVAHEAVFSHWPRLRRAIELIDADTRYARQVLEAAFQAYDRLKAVPREAEAAVIFDNLDRLGISAGELEVLLALIFRTGFYSEFLARSSKAEPEVFRQVCAAILSGSDHLAIYGLLSHLEHSVGLRSFFIRGDLARVEALAGSPMEAIARSASRLAGRHEKSTPYAAIPKGIWLLGAPAAPFSVESAPFAIALHPVTNLEYARFIEATGHSTPADWPLDESGEPRRPGVSDLPVVNVSYFDASAYCSFASDESGSVIRLPTEAEWEIACCATNGLTEGVAPAFAWGDEFNRDLCNTAESGIRRPTPIGMFSPLADSSLGVADLNGNVWEWTTSTGRLPDGTEVSYQASLSGKRDLLDPWAWGPRVQKGGTFLADERTARRDARLVNLPELALQDFGFRTVRDMGS